MAANKTPTKADFLAALEKKGIKNLADLIDAVMPEPDETGGYVWDEPGFGHANPAMPAESPGASAWFPNFDYAVFGMSIAKLMTDEPAYGG